MSELVKVEMLEPGIATVILNRAERRNALNIALLEQVCDVIDALERDPCNRVLILGGAGPVFSAGLDLREAADRGLVEHSAMAVQRILRRLSECSMISIAAVQGGAFAGGAGVVAACDIAIAAEEAKFGFPEARRGLLPALIFGVLRNKIRGGDLREMLLVGEPIDAPRALQIGLVQRVVPAKRLNDESLAVARAIVAGGPQTIRDTKAMLNAATSDPHDADRETQISTHLSARYSDEAQEGLLAFIEKREPRWK